MTLTLNKPQGDFIQSTARNTGFVAGLGSGKSYVATLKCIQKKLERPDLTVAYYLPNYGLIRDIAFDKFPTMLSDMGIKYNLNKSDKEIHIVNAGKIIFRSMDNPETIVGFEVYYSLIDECDILNQEKMTTAYNKILARNRQLDDRPNQLDIVGTPEGFRFFYNRYVTNFNEETDLLVRARTYDNKYLPDDYIDNLRQQYPSNLIEAYLNGVFINLATGSIYSYYDRNQHATNLELTHTDVLHIGQDFNTGGCISVVYVIKDGIPHAVDEIKSNDTFQVATNIKNRYPDNTIIVYPDASGASAKTSAQQSDIKILKNAGFIVKAKAKNPAVKDRINSANTLFDKNMIRVNYYKCPKLAEAFEQHSYDEKGDPEKFNGGGTVDDYTDAATYMLYYLFGLNKAVTTSIRR